MTVRKTCILMKIKLMMPFHFKDLKNQIIYTCYVKAFQIATPYESLFIFRGPDKRLKMKL